MNWVLNLINSPSFRVQKRTIEVEELRKVKLKMIVTEEKQQAEDIIHALKKSNRIREEIQ
jgi:hypothetical protein